MTNAELIQTIRNEIKRRYKEFDGKTGDIATASRLAYLDVLSFLDTLEESEKPMNFVFNYEFSHFLDKKDEELGSTTWSEEDLQELARHFAQWGAEHTPLPEDTVLFNKGVEEGKRLMMEEAVEGTLGYGPHLQRPIIMLESVPDIWDGGCKQVRVIILKED